MKLANTAPVQTSTCRSNCLFDISTWVPHRHLQLNRSFQNLTFHPLPSDQPAPPLFPPNMVIDTLIHLTAQISNLGITTTCWISSRPLSHPPLILQNTYDSEHSKGISNPCICISSVSFLVQANIMSYCNIFPVQFYSFSIHSSHSSQSNHNI